MNTQKKSAPYIVLDGLDGCGKGTQLGLLMARAEIEGSTCILTREPGGAPLSESLRELFKSPEGVAASALTQFLMMWASRRNYLETVVWPALDHGLPVFSDRGDSSTIAYQIYAKAAPELEAEFWKMRKLVFGNREPDLYIILAVPPSVARDRALADKEHTSAFDVSPIEWYERVNQGFLAFAKAIPHQVVFVDGTRSPEEVHDDVSRIVARYCNW